MPGILCLVGAGEFLPAMADLDRQLLAATGRARPRVVVIPTASWPDGEPVFRRWADMGVEHFEALGAEVEPVLARHRDDALDPAYAQAVGEADVVYLSGGRPDHLRSALRGTPLGRALCEAHVRGAVVAGCSAGAMILAHRLLRFGRRRPPLLARWDDALGLAPCVAVLPHYDRWPEVGTLLLALQSRRGVLLGIDEETAVVGRDGVWQVHGRGRATVWRGRHRRRYRAGESFALGS